MAFAFSAKNARILYSTNTWLLATKWTINVKVDELDYSNFESQGYTVYTGGLWDADISFDAFVDGGGTDPFSTGAVLTPGNVVGPFKFYLANTTAAASVGNNVVVPPTSLPNFWSFPSLFIATVNMDTEVRGFVRYSVTAKPGAAGWTMP